MKLFCVHRAEKRKRGGFSLVEATFSIGVMSCGILTLAPLLAMGLKTSRWARDDNDTAQIAQTLVEEARQGTVAPGTVYLDSDGATCASTQAAYAVKVATDSPASALTRVTLRVTPTGAPDHARIYAAVYPTPN